MISSTGGVVPDHIAHANTIITIAAPIQTFLFFIQSFITFSLPFVITIFIMYKILILAYLIGQSPVETQKTFQMEQTFRTMEECKEHLVEMDPDRGTYDVLWDFVNKMNFKYDWLLAGCKNDQTGEEFLIEPSYPKGKPDELRGLDFRPDIGV